MIGVSYNWVLIIVGWGRGKCEVKDIQDVKGFVLILILSGIGNNAIKE